MYTLFLVCAMLSVTLLPAVLVSLQNRLEDAAAQRLPSFGTAEAQTAKGPQLAWASRAR